MGRIPPPGTTGNRTTLALWRRGHVDVTHAEAALDLIRRALPIIGSAKRPTALKGGGMRFQHGMSSVSHERIPGMRTRIRVVTGDEAIDVRISGREGPGEHLPMAPAGDPDPARFAIAAVEIAITAMEALSDARTSFEPDEESRFVGETIRGATRAAILANAPDRSSVILRAPWMRASITAPGDLRIGLPLESSIQFDLLPDMVQFDCLWMDDIDPEMTECHVEMSAFEIPMEGSDVVGNMRLASGPPIVPTCPTRGPNAMKGDA